MVLAVVAQALPAETSLNQSLYVVYAGFHDYFFDLYEKKLTAAQVLDSVPDVVAAITTAIEVISFWYSHTFISVNRVSEEISNQREYWQVVSNVSLQSLVAADAQEILVVNLPPLGCNPALLTLYAESYADEYDLNGCLKKINLITDTHNRILEDEIIKIRAKYPAIYLYYGNAHAVYSDILGQPSKYSKALTCTG